MLFSPKILPSPNSKPPFKNKQSKNKQTNKRNRTHITLHM